LKDLIVLPAELVFRDLLLFAIVFPLLSFIDENQSSYHVSDDGRDATAANDDQNLFNYPHFC